MIIQRRAGQLEPGDILPAAQPYPRRVVLRVTESDGMVRIATMLESFDKSDNVDVEVRPDNLTPAQQHADELLNLAREVAAVDPPKRGVRADEHAAWSK